MDGPRRVRKNLRQVLFLDRSHLTVSDGHPVLRGDTAIPGVGVDLVGTLRERLGEGPELAVDQLGRIAYDADGDVPSERDRDVLLLSVVDEVIVRDFLTGFDLTRVGRGLVSGVSGKELGQVDA